MRSATARPFSFWLSLDALGSKLIPLHPDLPKDNSCVSRNFSCQYKESSADILRLHALLPYEVSGMLIEDSTGKRVDC